MLPSNQLIPLLTVRTSQGRVVRAWDFKQKQNLVIAFLDARCLICEGFLQALALHAGDLEEREAKALLVLPQARGSSIYDSRPAEIIVGMDTDGSDIRRFLGEDALSVGGLVRRGVFVTDRYGELYDQWIVEGHEFPKIEQILSSLHSIEMVCEECGDPPWLLDQ
jgi:peroxiredoxin